MFTEKEQEEIKNKYLNGVSTQELCQQYNSYRKKITSVLKSFGIKLRKGHISKRITIVNCNTCQKDFNIKSYVAKKNKHVFCSRDCYNIFHQCFWEQKCKHCGLVFTTTKKSKLYCSRDCYKQDYKPINFGKFSIKGKFTSSKCKESVSYDSSYELRRFYQYELDKNIISFERCKDKIAYIYKGKTHYYHPDFTLYYKNKIVVEEIKGYIGELEIAKFQAGKNFYKQKGIEYKIVTLSTLESFDIIDPIVYTSSTQDFVYSWADNVYTQLSCAKLYSQLSNCIRYKVACFIVDKNSFENPSNNNGIFYLGTGVNKGTCKSLESGKCGCVHAEVSAIENFQKGLLYQQFKDAEKIVFLTLSPCKKCAQLLIDNKVTTLYYLNNYRDTQGLKLLQEHGVKTISYSQYFKVHIYSNR